MAKQRKSLPKGSYISTGTCTPAIPVKKGDIISANFYTLGSVQLTLI